MLARGAVDRVSARRGDTDWLAAAWADPGTRVLVLDNASALVRFGDKEAELILVPPAEAPDGLRFLLGVDDAGVAYFGVMGPPGCLESLIKDVEAPAEDSPAEGRGSGGPGSAAGARPGSGRPGSGRPGDLGAARPRSSRPRSRQTPEQQTAGAADARSSRP